MNILPHKSWHVRTKANIAKVRKDQAQAAADEQEQQRKRSLAEQEVRLSILRSKSQANQAPISTAVDVEPLTSSANAAESQDPDNAPSCSTSSSAQQPWHNEHINLFADLDGLAKPNAEHVADKKEEQEKYEKQIGYLTYLGQDTNEATGRRDWYERAPERDDPHASRRGVEVSVQRKLELDPLAVMQRYAKQMKAQQEAMATTAATKRLELKYPVGTIADSLVRVVEKLEPAKKERSSELSRHEEKRPKTRSTGRVEKRKHKKSKSTKEHRRSEHKKRRRRRSGSSSGDDDERRRAKRRKRSSDDGGCDDEVAKREKLVRLRAERLAREQSERERIVKLLGPPKVEPGRVATKRADTGGLSINEAAPVAPQPPLRQKYNSQFNPYLAKQNYE